MTAAQCNPRPHLRPSVSSTIYLLSSGDLLEIPAFAGMTSKGVLCVRDSEIKNREPEAHDYSVYQNGCYASAASSVGTSSAEASASAGASSFGWLFRSFSAFLIALDLSVAGAFTQSGSVTFCA